MNAPTFTRPTGAHLRLQNIGAPDYADKPYDAAALRLIAALDMLAPKARPQVCGSLADRIDEAERMADAMRDFRDYLADFLVRWATEFEGWVASLDTHDFDAFIRNPIEHFDMLTDRLDQFAAENRELHLAEIA